MEAEIDVDQCLLRQLEKRIDGLMSELADVCRGILLLDHGSEELLEQGSSLKKALYVVDLDVYRLLHEQMTSLVCAPIGSLFVFMTRTGYYPNLLFGSQ